MEIKQTALAYAKQAKERLDEVVTPVFKSQGWDKGDVEKATQYVLGSLVLMAAMATRKSFLLTALSVAGVAAAKRYAMDKVEETQSEETSA